MAEKRVGFIGTGIMGKPMAENLVDAGYTVVVHNRSREPVEELTAYGAEAAASPREVAERTEVLFTALPDGEVVEEVALGEDGIVDGVGDGDVMIDVSTISPGTVRLVAEALAERGAHLLDAPISGGEPGAEAGTLSIMVGGDRSVLKDHRDVLDAVGETVTYCGPQGSGQVAKACNQIVLGATLFGVAEAFVFAQKAAADLEAVRQAISGGAAACWVLDSRAPKMLSGDFEPGGYVRYLKEDLEIAQEAGGSVGAPLFVTGIVQELLTAAVENGYGTDDIAAAIRVVEMLAGEQARAD